MNPLIAKVLVCLGSLMAAFLFGLMYERGKLQEYKGEIKGAVNVQEQTTKTTDTKNEGDAHASQENYVQAINSLDAYYRAHPVIRVQHDGSCTMPQTSGNTERPDAVATGFYASPYSPRDTEIIAERLHELQQRLIAGGVIVR